MRVYINKIGKWAHLTLYPETQEDNQQIAHLEASRPHIGPGEFENISDDRTYFLARTTVHESEESLAHLFRLILGEEILLPPSFLTPGGSFSQDSIAVPSRRIELRFYP